MSHDEAVEVFDEQRFIGAVGTILQCTKLQAIDHSLEEICLLRQAGRECRRFVPVHRIVCKVIYQVRIHRGTKVSAFPYKVPQPRRKTSENSCKTSDFRGGFWIFLQKPTTVFSRGASFRGHEEQAASYWLSEQMFPLARTI